MKTKKCYEGAKKCIELLCDDEEASTVESFINALNTKDRRKIDVLFELMCEKGNIFNKEKFKKLEGSDGVFEFKSFQIRLLCFLAPGQRVIICRGIFKKKDKHDRSDVSFVEACRVNFLESGSDVHQ